MLGQIFCLIYLLSDYISVNNNEKKTVKDHKAIFSDIIHFQDINYD